VHKLLCITFKGISLAGSIGKCMLYEEKNLEEWVGCIEKNCDGSSGICQQERPLLFLPSGWLSSCWTLRLGGHAEKKGLLTTKQGGHMM
jgi:hypothetical protein